MKVQEQSDTEIVRRILEGNIQAFSLLMKRYSPLITNIIARKVPEDKVEELLQETFLQAFKGLWSYKSKGALKAWLSAIAVRRCYDFWRQHYRKPEDSFSQFSAEQESWLERLLATDSCEAFEEQAKQAEAKEVLDWALAHLKPEDRMALALVHLENHSVKEAAQLLGWSESKVKVRMHRARLEMRTLLYNLITE